MNYIIRKAPVNLFTSAFLIILLIMYCCIIFLNSSVLLFPSPSDSAMPYILFGIPLICIMLLLRLVCLQNTKSSVEENIKEILYSVF